LFFDNEILVVIEKETNRYAEQQINKKKEEGPLKPKTVHGQWKEASVQEIKLFFAIVINMCLLRKPYIRDYWRTKPIIRTKHAKSVGVSTDRFVANLTMLHLNNNETRVPRDQAGYDPLYKV
jgi:hypothetical protein